MKKIELILSGGLGNQMLQYAYARKVQLDSGNCKLVINTVLYDSDRFKRNFSLMQFFLNEDVDVINKAHPLIRVAGGFSNYFEKTIYNIFSFFNICIWRSKKYRKLKDCQYIYGYFQSEKYFHKYARLIKKELHVKTRTEQKNIAILNRINSTNSVCIHIRRGDYISENLLMCDQKYYETAISYMKAELDNPTFFLFSDDIKWVKDNYKDANYVYVENANKDYQELELMYNCKHFIMSNSSFSWWAQYLSDYDDKIVIAPAKWMPNDIVSDIYMDNWCII